MNILITGGCGFIGNTLAHTLKKDHNVTVFDIDTYWIDYIKDIKYISGDITDYNTLRQCLKGIDVVYHLAGVSNTMECVKNPLHAIDINCKGTANVLQACRQTGVSRIILAGSSLISTLTFDNSPSNIVDVEKSNHIYVTTKLFQEMLVRDFEAMYGLPYTILRYGICYGPGMTPGVVVYNFVKQALEGKPMTIHGDGSQWRQYIYVGDLVEANVKVLDRPPTKNSTLNIVPLEKIRVIDIAHAICKEIPEATIKFEASRSHDLDVKYMHPDKSYAVLYWGDNITSLQEGIRKTIEYYRKYGFGWG